MSNTRTTGRQKTAGSRSRSLSGRRRRTRKKGFLSRLAHCPSWAMWLGGLLITALYVGLFYHFFVNPFSFRWKAMYGESPYPEGFNVRGIDISHYQSSIDWEQLRNADIHHDPVRFVFIKATEGVNLMDDNFNDNFYQARRNDFIRGAYHFYVPGIDARRQAEFYLHQVHLEAGDLPPVLDVEKMGSLNRQQLQKDIKTWLRIVERHYHVKPILYTSYKFKTENLSDSVLNTYPYWIAHYYVEKLQYRGPWKFWQHTDCGKVQGIKGFVDCDIFNGSPEELEDMCLKEEDLEEDE